MALALLWQADMSTAVEIVYELRQRLARCRSSETLDMADLEAIADLEHELAGPASVPEGTVARVRAGKDEDPVTLVEVSASRMAITAAPYVEPGALVEVMIDDEGLGRSYRFKGRVTSLDDAADDLFRFTLELVGAPLLLRKPARTAPVLAAAAAEAA